MNHQTHARTHTLSHTYKQVEMQRSVATMHNNGFVDGRLWTYEHHATAEIKCGESAIFAFVNLFLIIIQITFIRYTNTHTLSRRMTRTVTCTEKGPQTIYICI